MAARKKSTGKKSAARKTTARKTTTRKTTSLKTSAAKGAIPKMARGVEKAAKTPAGRAVVAAVKDVATAAIDAVAQSAKQAVSGRGLKTAATSAKLSAARHQTRPER